MTKTFRSYTITAADHKTAAVVFPDRGGWVSSIKLPFRSGVREILFQHDYANDAEIKDLLGGLPFLFPICGRLSRNSSVSANRSAHASEHEESVYLYDGKLYPMKIHGFSWYEKWTLANITENTITMVLRQNENTLKQYPFHFEVKLTYEVQPGKIFCHQSYKNCETNRVMPYYAGFHPYFLIPDKKSDVILNFESTRRLQYNAALTDIVGEQSILKTPVSISNPDINEQLNILGNNRTVTLSFPNGDVIKTTPTQHPDYFPYLQLYTIPEKPFFCIEQWMAFPNAMNTVFGVRWLKPGEIEEATYEIDCNP